MADDPPIYFVDAFVGATEEGNPAAVCLLNEDREAAWMQALAQEIGLSETAFVQQPVDGMHALRWFTPVCEVDLCGHATLASAHILWQEGRLPSEEEARFSTRSGTLIARKRDDWIEMDFPREDASRIEEPVGLADALGVDAIIYTAKSRMDYLVEVASEEGLRNMRPDYDALKTISSRGFIVTSASYAVAYDFVSRFFAPAAGIDEDPVTGSAHCTLGPFWAERLGKTHLNAYQASDRGGVVRLRVTGKTVTLSGQARSKRKK